MNKKSKYHGIENPRYAREMHELRSSNAAGIHQDKRDRRCRTRGASKSRAICDYK